MIGLKNPNSILPIYGKLEQQQDCGGCIDSPRNRTLPFQIPLSSVPEGLAWKLVSCDGSGEIQLSSLLLELICMEDGSTTLVYDGSVFDVEVPCGCYYLEFLIGDDVCYSEKLCMGGECGLEIPCLEPVSCDSWNGCCPIGFPTGNSRPRLGCRRRNNIWQVLGWNILANNSIVANGGTNISYSYNVYDTTLGLPGIPVAWQFGGTPISQFARVNLPFTTTSIRYEGSISFDLECQGIISRVTISFEGTCTQPVNVGTNWNWQFLDFDCTELQTDGFVLTLSACDTLSGELLQESIDIWNGTSWDSIPGNTTTIYVPNTIPAITKVRRTITTECSGIISQEFDFTPADLNCA